MRRTSRQHLFCNFLDEDILFPLIDQVGNAWSSPADGVARYTPYRASDDVWDSYIEYYLTVLRK